MDPRVIKSILSRLARLERESVRLRKGRISGIAPYDVQLGGSTTAYENIPSMSAAAVGDNVAALVSGNNAVILGQPTNRLTWNTLPLESGWAELNSNYTPMYAKAPNGLVALRGLVVKSTAWRVYEHIGTVPAGFRPSVEVEKIFATVVNDTGVGGVSVDTAGRVVIRQATWVNNLTWISLDPIIYWAEG